MKKIELRKKIEVGWNYYLKGLIRLDMLVPSVAFELMVFWL
jgi:hypothetical protein